MALTFGADIGDRVVLAAGIDNQHTFTLLLWVYRTADIDFRRLMSKGSGDEKSLLNWNTGADDIALLVKRSTTNATGASAASAFPQNVWTYVAATYDGTDGPRLFRGTLTAAAAEVTYASRTVGAGAELSDAGDAWAIGNDSFSGSFAAAFGGRIAFAAHYARRFSLAEVIRHQFRPSPDADCRIFMHLGWNGAGTQANWAPAATPLNGTVTGATVADHVPLPVPFGLDVWPSTAAAGSPSLRRLRVVPGDAIGLQRPLSVPARPLY